ncbi:MAG: hypothetical protein KJO82_10125, partial [Gammaproteobacteria bacterium]|nr:hypothetical protein [Gammaproteobacteria bacterium]
TVIVLSNVYNSTTTTVGSDVAAMYFGISTAAPTLSLEPLPERQLSGTSGSFRFGADFYNPNAEVMVDIRDGHAYLVWNGGPFESALVATGPDRFVDRMFWSDVEFIRDDDGTVVELLFDQFSGQRVD